MVTHGEAEDFAVRTVDDITEDAGLPREGFDHLPGAGGP